MAPSPAAQSSVAAEPKPGTILDHRSGSAVDFDAMVERLATASIVYVGEQHDQAQHHAFQARVLFALVDRWSADSNPTRPIALGLEMFQKPSQPALDAYAKGEIDEKTMLEKTEWATRWGYGWEMYAPMLRLCREKHLSIVALNAPKEITRTVSRKGLDGLTPEQRASLPPLDLSDAGHRAFVKEAFGAHGASMPADTFERFYTAQVIWEETMSSSVAEWLLANGPSAHMVVVAGDGHIADRFGVPARAAKKSQRPYLTVVSLVVEPDDGKPHPAEPSLRRDVRYADYTAYFAPSAPAAPPKPSAPKSPPTPAAPVPPAKDAVPPK